MAGIDTDRMHGWGCEREHETEMAGERERIRVGKCDMCPQCCECILNLALFLVSTVSIGCSTRGKNHSFLLLATPHVSFLYSSLSFNNQHELRRVHRDTNTHTHTHTHTHTQAQTHTHT